MDDEVLEAEVVFRHAVEEAKNELILGRESAEKNQLNRALGATVAVVIVALLLSHIITTPLENDINENNSEGYPPIWERYLSDFTTDDAHSFVLQNGTLTGPDGASLWSGTHNFVEFEYLSMKVVPLLMEW